MTRLRVNPSLFLATPAAIWFLLFLVVPLVGVLILSFLTRGSHGSVELIFTLKNYARSMDPLYFRILLQSIILAASVTFWTLLIGAPTAYVIARSRTGVKAFLVVAIMLPFFTNFILRAWAIRTMFGALGPVRPFLEFIGLGSLAGELTSGTQVVWFGMVTNYLPFMIIPLFVVFEKFDFRLLDAAKDLGASKIQMIFRILLPTTLPGVIAGCLLVFVPALGEFLIPDFLGGAKTMLVGNLVTEQFLRARDWPFGAALVVQVIAVVIAVSMLRFLRRR